MKRIKASANGMERNERMESRTRKGSLRSVRRIIWFSGVAAFGLSGLFPVLPAFAREGKARLYSGDLVYKGAFAYPEDDAWAYSGHALAS